MKSDVIYRIKELLLLNNQTISTVESMTAGGIAHRLTSIEGSSLFFTSALVTYSISAKLKLLSLEKDYFSKVSVYSLQCAEKMAHQGLKKLKSDYCLSISGIASAIKEEPELAVGTIFLGLATRKSVISKSTVVEGSNRSKIRENAICAALNFFEENMNQSR
ncbi:MAG: CinA family protein [Oligoflexales bacterium]|nr:CinA family protein [Oligoflexales bacterium]